MILSIASQGGGGPEVHPLGRATAVHVIHLLVHYTHNGCYKWRGGDGDGDGRLGGKPNPTASGQNVYPSQYFRTCDHQPRVFVFGRLFKPRRADDLVGRYRRVKTNNSTAFLQTFTRRTRANFRRTDRLFSPRQGVKYTLAWRERAHAAYVTLSSILMCLVGILDNAFLAALHKRL